MSGLVDVGFAAPDADPGAGLGAGGVAPEIGGVELEDDAAAVPDPAGLAVPAVSGAAPAAGLLLDDEPRLELAGLLAPVVVTVAAGVEALDLGFERVVVAPLAVVIGALLDSCSRCHLGVLVWFLGLPFFAPFFPFIMLTSLIGY